MPNEQLQIEKLAGLCAPQNSDLKLDCRLNLATSVFDHPPALNQPQTIKLGQTFELVIANNHPCSVIIVNLATSGRHCILWPNRWQQINFLPSAGEHRFPTDFDNPIELVAKGTTGMERLVVIASLEPLQLSLDPLPGEDVRPICGEFISQTLAAIDNLGGAGWSVAHVAFTICDR